MATNITQNGVTFNYDNTKGVGAALGGVYTHLNNKENGKYYYDADSPKVLMALAWNAPNDVVLKTVAATSPSYFSVGTTAVTASNYTTVNNATTTIPTTKEYTNTGSRAFAYILVPSDKTVSVIEKVLGGTVTVTEVTDVSISGHKVYKTGGAVAQNGTIVITIQ